MSDSSEAVDDIRVYKLERNSLVHLLDSIPVVSEVALWERQRDTETETETVTVTEGWQCYHQNLYFSFSSSEGDIPLLLTFQMDCIADIVSTQDIFCAMMKNQ